MGRRPTTSTDARGHGTVRGLGEVLMPTKDLDQMIDVLAAMPGI